MKYGLCKLFFMQRNNWSDTFSLISSTDGDKPPTIILLCAILFLLKCFPSGNIVKALLHRQKYKAPEFIMPIGIDAIQVTGVQSA